MKIYTFNDKVLTRNTKWLKEYEEPTPPTPSLPPYTIRMKFTDGVTPSFSKGTLTQVSSSPNIWDLTYENSDWSNLIKNQTNLIEVIDANIINVTNLTSLFESCTGLTTVALFDTSNVTSLFGTFYQCSSLTSVPLFNTSNVTNMNQMFTKCSSLTSVPLFNTSNVTNMYSMFRETGITSIPLFDTSKVTEMYCTFYKCSNVQSGALALYQQASTQATPPTSHYNTFYNCGSNTTTGAAELAQIPSSWGGTAS